MLHHYHLVTCTPRRAPGPVGRRDRLSSPPAPRRRRPRFYPDDPIAREPESQDASKAAPYDQSQMYELVYNLFVTSGHKPSGLRAKNINTIDEVPDSSWFTNRIGTRPVTTEELIRGAERRRAARSVEVGADPGEDGRRAPGLHRDGRQGRHLVPRVRSAGVRRTARPRAVAIATKIFWALGYNQVESFLTTFDPKNDDDRSEGDGAPAERQADAVHAATTSTRSSRGSRATPDGTLSRHRRPPAARQDSRRLPVCRHAPRRSQRSRAARASPRAARAARLRRVDEPHRPQGARTRSTRVITENGKSIVKHYLQDVGSTFGMCNDFHEWDLSYEYFLEGARRGSASSRSASG